MESILIVDDEEIDRIILSKLIEKVGGEFQILTAEDGINALAFCNQL